MKRGWIILLLFSALTFNIRADIVTPDSLLNKYYHGETDSIQVYGLREIINFWNGKDCDSSIYYAHRIIPKAKEIEIVPFVYKGYYWIINCYGNTGHSDSSLKYAFESISYFEEKEAHYPLAVVLTLIGEQYRAMAMFDNSVKYLQEAWYASIKLDDKHLGTSVANRLAATYYEKKNKELALQWADSSISLAKIEGNKDYFIRNLNIKGAVYRDLEQYDQALENFLAAYQYAKNYKNDNDYYSLLNNIAIMYQMLNVPDSTIHYALESYLYSSEKGIRALTVVSSEQLATAYSSVGDYKNAYNFSRIYEEIRNEVLFEERDKQVAELNTKYETAQKEQTIALQERDIADQNQRLKQNRIFTFMFVIIVILLLSFIIYRYRISRRLKQALNDRELLLREIHHRVKNNFQMVSSLLELQSKEIKDEGALRSIHEGQERMHAMAIIHQKLYQTNDLKKIDFGEYTRLLIHDNLEAYRNEMKIKVSVDIQDMSFDIDTAIPLGLILNELITNAFKYAFSPQKENSLYIQITKDTDLFYLLRVKDSGDGLADPNLLHTSKSFGLKLVSRLSKQLRGSVSYKYENGSIFDILFKDTYQRKELD